MLRSCSRPAGARPVLPGRCSFQVCPQEVRVRPLSVGTEMSFRVFVQGEFFARWSKLNENLSNRNLYASGYVFVDTFRSTRNAVLKK